MADTILMRVATFLLCLTLTFVYDPRLGFTYVRSPSVERQQKEILASVQSILSELYLRQPQARSSIANSYGYAIFNNTSFKIIFAGGGHGRGVAMINRIREPIFMRMLEIQGGLGLGIKQFRLIWVFDTQESFERFTNLGWELSAQATAVAKINNRGTSYQGAIAIAPDIWLYQLTENGLALELTLKGTKYYLDSKLNTG